MILVQMVNAGLLPATVTTGVTRKALVGGIASFDHSSSAGNRERRANLLSSAQEQSATQALLGGFHRTTSRREFSAALPRNYRLLELVVSNCSLFIRL